MALCAALGPEAAPPEAYRYVLMASDAAQHAASPASLRGCFARKNDDAWPRARPRAMAGTWLALAPPV
jgi:hypothetical protein